MAEACSGKSSDFIPDTDGITGLKYQGIYYHAERDDKFQSNYSALTSPLSNFKALFDMPVLDDYKSALKLIEHHVLEANDNVVVCIDNVTAMIPSLMKNHKVTDFINGLKHIRKDPVPSSSPVPNNTNRTTSGATSSPTFQATGTSRKDVTLEVAKMFYVENKYQGLSWNKIFESHASEYALKDRNTVSNKVNALPRMIRKAFTDDILVEIWGMSEVYCKSPEEILQEADEKYGISQKSTIQYIIDKAPELTSRLSPTN